MDPINYDAGNAQDAILGGLKLGAGIQHMEQQRVAQQQAQQALLQQQLELQRLASNPNASHADYAAAMTKYPGLAENLGKGFKVLEEGQRQNLLNFGTRVYGALNSGNTQVGVDLLRERAKADPQGSQHWTMLADLAEKSPQDAKFMGALSLAGMLGPEKFATAFPAIAGEQRAAEKAPAELAKAKSEAVVKGAEAARAGEKVDADIGKTQADIAKAEEEVAASKARTRNDALKYNLDVDRYNLDFDKALEEVRQKRLNGGVTLSAGMEKAQADSVGAALVAKSASTQAAQVADLLRKDQQSGGVWTWTAAKWRDVFGSDSPLPQMRRDYIRIRNQGLLQDLPPGPASDRDISLMKEGYPPENADGATLANWLDAFGRVQAALAQKEEAKADWISAVGALKTAPRDIEVMGVRVPAGTSFLDFVKRGVKPDTTAPAAAKTGYMEKYGR